MNPFEMVNSAGRASAPVNKLLAGVTRHINQQLPVALGHLFRILEPQQALLVYMRLLLKIQGVWLVGLSELNIKTRRAMTRLFKANIENPRCNNLSLKKIVETPRANDSSP